MRVTRRRFLALLGAAFAGCAIDALIEPALLLEVSHVELRLDIEEPLRILHVTDLHFGGGSPPSIYQVALDAVKTVEPSFIALTGDLISRAASASQAVDFVAKLTSYAPIYAVPGNWEYWSLGEGGVRSFLSQLEGLGRVRTMVNDAEEVAGIQVVGVDDPHLLRSDLDSALAKAGRGLKVLLAHSPEIIRDAAGRVDVVLAGHTHGGQVALPLIGPPYVPVRAEYRRYARGLFLEKGTYMYVCRGVGTSLVPLRFMCRPEVVIVDLLPIG
ncbi:MAG: metallophosphoesterase [Candidatus Nezhaarchaeota archaeon]|nr:metallophosphoesterase [Candidatus Nezhaarchaeota archaeon]